MVLNTPSQTTTCTGQCSPDSPVTLLDWTPHMPPKNCERKKHVAIKITHIGQLFYSLATEYPYHSLSSGYPHPLPPSPHLYFQQVYTQTISLWHTSAFSPLVAPPPSHEDECASPYHYASLSCSVGELGAGPGGEGTHYRFHFLKISDFIQEHEIMCSNFSL